MRLVNESLDASFERILDAESELPADLLRTLPRRLGISTAAIGGWDEYSKLDPMRNLPVYFRALCPAISDAELDDFVLAHRAGGFAGLVIDRILDGQVVGDEVVVHAAHFLIDRWIELVARAARLSPRAVASVVRESLERLVSAAEREERFFEEGIDGADLYASVIADKTEWLALASRFMVHLHGDESAEPIFDRCFEALLLALQISDDAIDATEDRALRGRSIPECLDVEPTSLLVAAERLLTEAAAELRTYGLDELAGFSIAQAAALARSLGPVSASDGLGAVFFLADVLGRESGLGATAGERAILAACAHGSDSTNDPASSSDWYWPAVS